ATCSSFRPGRYGDLRTVLNTVLPHLRQGDTIDLPRFPPAMKRQIRPVAARLFACRAAAAPAAGEFS
ncbi:MAG TPA: hypothetical protein VEF90_17920, partial [Xanthobacteraceae bacterium]|nr:hypothetical protein [Xanthobacteraceae bacterium]